MSDLFEREENVLQDSLAYLEKIKGGEHTPNASELVKKHGKLAKEYARVLRQLRRVTKMTDRTTDQLNTDRLQLMDEVNYDALTCIYNRRYLETQLPEIIETLGKSGEVLSVLMLDVDYFKKYNDRYGHSEGDECLRTLAGAMAKRVGRKDDFVARYGGEEFTIVLPHTDKDGALFIADCVLKAVQELDITHEDSAASSCVTVSIGATTGTVGEEQTPLHYLQRADAALYQAKQDGRNRCVYLPLEEG